MFPGPNRLSIPNCISIGPAVFGPPFVKLLLSDRLLSCLYVTLVYCGQTVGWIKMPLSREVGLGPGDIVLDRYSAPTRKGAQQHPPLFGPLCSGTVAHLSNCWDLVLQVTAFRDHPGEPVPEENFSRLYGARED